MCLYVVSSFLKASLFTLLAFHHHLWHPSYIFGEAKQTFYIQRLLSLAPPYVAKKILKFLQTTIKTCPCMLLLTDSRCFIARETDHFKKKRLPWKARISSIFHMTGGLSVTKRAVMRFFSFLMLFVKSERNIRASTAISSCSKNAKHIPHKIFHIWCK